MLRESPLHTLLERAGAQFEEVAGWVMAATFGDPHDELRRGLERVSLVDLSCYGKILVEGAVSKGLRNLPKVGESRSTRRGSLYRLRVDRLLVMTEPGQEAATVDYLRDRKTFLTVTDLTDGLAGLGVFGHHSVTLLRRLCGLDFHQDLPDRGVSQSSLAKTSQTLIRHDVGGTPFYHLVGSRSSAEYLWLTIEQAVGELGLVKAGWSAYSLLLKQENSPQGR